MLGQKARTGHLISQHWCTSDTLALNYLMWWKKIHVNDYRQLHTDTYVMSLGIIIMDAHPLFLQQTAISIKKYTCKWSHLLHTTTWWRKHTIQCFTWLIRWQFSMIIYVVYIMFVFRRFLEMWFVDTAVFGKLTEIIPGQLLKTDNLIFTTVVATCIFGQMCWFK